MANALYPVEPSSALGNATVGKLSKASVRYGMGGDHCGCCMFYICPEGEADDEIGTCDKVEGPIGEDMWCELFKRGERPET